MSADSRTDLSRTVRPNLVESGRAPVVDFAAPTVWPERCNRVATQSVHSSSARDPLSTAPKVGLLSGLLTTAVAAAASDFECHVCAQQVKTAVPGKISRPHRKGSRASMSTRAWQVK